MVCKRNKLQENNFGKSNQRIKGMLKKRFVLCAKLWYICMYSESTSIVKMSCLKMALIKGLKLVKTAVVVLTHSVQFLFLRTFAFVIILFTLFVSFIFFFSFPVIISYFKLSKCAENESTKEWCRTRENEESRKKERNGIEGSRRQIYAANGFFHDFRSFGPYFMT